MPHFQASEASPKIAEQTLGAPECWDQVQEEIGEAKEAREGVGSRGNNSEGGFSNSWSGSAEDKAPD